MTIIISTQELTELLKEISKQSAKGRGPKLNKAYKVLLDLPKKHRGNGGNGGWLKPDRN
jgi:hypothetical protein